MIALTVLFSLAALGLTVARPNPAVAAGGPSSDPVTKTATAGRTHLVDGRDVEVESLDISMTVSQTADLRAGQQIGVTWTGAHPTGGIIPDPSEHRAQFQEYPMVLMQCRGIDSPESPMSPETCWTQSPSERYFADNDYGFPGWRLDRYAGAAARTAHPGRPETMPGDCVGDQTLASAWVPYIGADGTVYPGGPGNGCAGIPSEASAERATPANTTYAVTDPTGAGSSRFEIWDQAINQSLGCSAAVPCSLVAVPIVGISCDLAAEGLDPRDRAEVAAAQDPEGILLDDIEARCEATGRFRSGAISSQPGTNYDAAVSGSFWWSASNWRNRLSFPLSFATSGAVCDVTSDQHPTLLYGSALFAGAAQQWAPAFCTDPDRFTFRHIQYSDSGSLSLVSGPQRSIDAALVSNPALEGYPTPTVNAPVAVSGFAISYLIDGADRSPYTDLKLTPRLLAKLLTGSYPGYLFARDYNEPLRANPLNLTTDPEFLALNPGAPRDTPASIAASTLYALSSDADVTTALTSYIEADAEARAWLDGDPDPWGMVVNPPYRGITLPVATWPLLDTFDLQNPDAPDTKPTLGACTVTTPWLNLVASPTQSLRTIANSVKFGLPQSQTNCSQTFDVDQQLTGERFVAGVRQQQGFRFMLGITSLADAALFQLDAASLQSTSSITDYTAEFQDASGRSFAAPDRAGLQAAASTLSLQTGDAAAGNVPAPRFPVDYEALGRRANADAYPGTMVIYAVVPTKGLPGDTGARLATFLRFAASDGQTPGFGNGQLPPGYLPMTTAEGVGALAAYAVLAADAVEAQAGAVPGTESGTAGGAASPTGSVSAPASTTTSDPGSIPPAASTTSAPPTPPRPQPSSPEGADAPSIAPIGGTGPGASAAVTPLGAETPRAPGTLAELALPLLLALAVASGVVSGLISLRPRLRRRP